MMRAVTLWSKPLILGSCCGLLLAACGDDPAGPETPGPRLVPEDAIGAWRLDDFGPPRYLVVDEEGVRVLQSEPAFDCFVEDVMRVLSRSADFYSVETLSGRRRAELTMTASRGDLLVTLDGETGIYVRDDDGAAAIQRCEPAVPEQFQGSWMDRSTASLHYLYIGPSTMDIYVPVSEGCYEVFPLLLYGVDEGADGQVTVVGRNASSGDSFSYRLRREDGRLVRGNDWSYDPYAAGAQTLPTCPPGRGGGDPKLDCETLPPLTPGEAVEGRLSGTDPFARDRPYDLFKLELTERTTVRIEMTSTQIDPIVFLYAGDGEYLDQDDDGGYQLASRLVRTLEPGCYRVEASTFVDLRGDYLLTASTD